MLFLDGVGIGKKDAASNPFFSARLPHLRSLLGGSLPSLRSRICRGDHALAVPIDATFRVPGLPQSGTGQTALFTGINAPRVLGRHFGPYAHSLLRPIIREKNIFHQLKNRGKRICFANAYPDQFFHYIASGKTRFTVTTLACQMAGVPLRGPAELKRNDGVSADITRERWHDLGYPDMPTISPVEAGNHLSALGRSHDFTLFEYFLPDHAGHRQSMEQSVDYLERLDGLLGGFLDSFDNSTMTLVITSDHGNVESLDVRTHTRNPVPLIVAGAHRNILARSIKNLAHVTTEILRLYDSYSV
jgi:2,3-bisphosphoglycerate-independent phosphoglycerate mutase